MIMTLKPKCKNCGWTTEAHKMKKMGKDLFCPSCSKLVLTLPDEINRDWSNLVKNKSVF